MVNKLMLVGLLWVYPAPIVALVYPIIISVCALSKLHWYLDKFLKHFNIFHLLSLFTKKLDRGTASFSRYGHLKFTPEKTNSYITISLSKLQVPCCSYPLQRQNVSE